MYILYFAPSGWGGQVIGRFQDMIDGSSSINHFDILNVNWPY